MPTGRNGRKHHFAEDLLISSSTRPNIGYSQTPIAVRFAIIIFFAQRTPMGTA